MNVIMPVYIFSQELFTMTCEAISSLGKVDLTIIDNNSSTGGGFLRSIAKTYVRNTENIGYAKAVNQGLKLTTDEYIAVANNDIRVSPNWQEVAREVLNEDKAYSCHFRMTNYDVPFQYGNKTIYSGMERWCSSSFFVIRAKKPFLYDEQYFNSYDDWDYWHTVRNMGLKTAYTDRACYQHNHSYTKRQMNWEIKDAENLGYFKGKWGKSPEELYGELYPEQMRKPYAEGFQL